MKMKNVVGWENSLVVNDASILDCINNLERSGLKLALIVNESRQLLGTVSDGDVRRAIIKGFSLEAKCLDIMNASPIFAENASNQEFLIGLLSEAKVDLVPLVDQQKIVRGLWREIGESGCDISGAKFLIMAGGEGKRLRPHTENCPKPLVEVKGKPMILHIINRAREQGFCEFIVSLGYLGYMIEDYLGDGSQFGVAVEYIREQAPMGTAGALFMLKGRLNCPLVISNGDVISALNYRELCQYHQLQNAVATMAVRSYELQNPFGVVDLDGTNIVGFTEKPIYKSFINTGIYVLNPEVLDYLDDGGYCDMPTLLERVGNIGGKSVVAYPIHEEWIDIGRPEDLDYINE